MKITNYVFVLLFSCLNIQAQDKNEYQKFFADYLQKFDKVVYTEHFFDNLDEILDNLKNIDTLDKTNIKNFGQSKKLKEPIILSKQELNFVIEELRKNNGEKILPISLSKSQYVPRRRIEKIFKDADKGWSYFNIHYGRSLYTFSKPIFLRNNSICFFYSSNSCGNLCGSGSFSVYVKENGVWYFYHGLSMWIN